MKEEEVMKDEFEEAVASALKNSNFKEVCRLIVLHTTENLPDNLTLKQLRDTLERCKS